MKNMLFLFLTMTKSIPCAICGGTINTSPHHIRPKEEGGTNNKKNKIILCCRCHDLVEGIYQDIGMEYCPSVVRMVKRMIDIYEDKIDVTGFQRSQTSRRHRRHIVPLHREHNGRRCPIAGIHYTAVPTRDVLTGIMYRSKTAVGRALADENGMDSRDHFIYYRLAHAFPGRFVDA